MVPREGESIMRTNSKALRGLFAIVMALGLAAGSAAQALVDMAVQNSKAPVTTRKPARSGREAKRPRRAREDLVFIF